ncbi:MAG: leucyl aminopeptidase [Thermaerobacterales bacterium]
MRVQTGSVTEVACDALVVSLYQGAQPGGAADAVDTALDGAVCQAVADGEFTGKLYETLTLPTYGRLPARRVIVVGLGPKEQFDRGRARQAAAVAARRARRAGARQAATIVHGAGSGGLEATAAARALVEGTMSGLYRFHHYRTESDNRADPEWIVVESDPDKAVSLNEGLRVGSAFGRALGLARDLANEPPSRLTPVLLAERAAVMARTEGLECEILHKEDLERLKMGAVLDVGRGSNEPPVLIRISYRGRSNVRAGEGDDYDLALVGKGVTFDSGGLSLKTAAGMEDMKFDMAGAAAVIAAMQAIAQLKPDLDVLAVVPAVENLPGHKAQKPGDVINSFSGKTIEVLNTDAEGRLILADGVAYACHLGARRVVDVATLTGGARIALGALASALISNDDHLATLVESAAGGAGERVWRLPAWDEYRELYRSDIADIKNTGGPGAGAITGGLIIGDFAGDTPWAHLDLGPTAWASEKKAFAERGATGVATATLVQLALTLDTQ